MRRAVNEDFSRFEGGSGASAWDDRLPPERDGSNGRGSTDEKTPGGERARRYGGGSEEGRKGDEMGDAWTDVVISEWSKDKGEARSGVETDVPLNTTYRAFGFCSGLDLFIFYLHSRD